MICNFVIFLECVDSRAYSIGGGTALTLLPLSGSAIVSYGVDHSLSE